MFVVNIGINHKAAPVHIREKFMFPEPFLANALKEMAQLEPVSGCVILSTYNRTEVYADVSDVDGGIAEIKRFLSSCARISMDEIEGLLYTYTRSRALHHLFQVVSGFDPMVPRETGILEQTLNAYRIACEAGATSGIMDTLFRKAISVAQKIYTETGISKNAVSIGAAAVELSKKNFPDLRDKCVLIIGAGKMSELTAGSLLDNGISSVIVSNRSIARAEILSEKFGGKAIKFSEAFEYIQKADIVIVNTSLPYYIIHPSRVNQAMEARAGKPLCFIDVAVPRNVNPLIKNIDGVTLYTIDDIREVIDTSLK